VLKGAAPVPGSKDHLTGRTPPVDTTEGGVYLEFVSAAGSEVVVIDSGEGGVTEIVKACDTESGVAPLLA
jgi:hypothetical protein